MLTLGKLEDLLQAPARDRFETDFLTKYLPTQRWYGGKTRALRNARVIKAYLSPANPTFAPPSSAALWLMVRADYAQGQDEYYQLAFLFKPDPKGEWTLGGQEGHLADALQDPGFIADWLRRISQQPSVFAMLETGDRLESETRPGLLEGIAEAPEGLPSIIRPLHADQSNTAALIGDRLFLKFYRRLEAGISPEAEMVRYLGEAGFKGTPAWRGEIGLRPQGGQPIALALITDQVNQPENAWDRLHAVLKRFASDAATEALSTLNQLGAVTAQMHTALAKGKTPAFLPEPFAEGEPVRLADAIAVEVEASLILLRENLAGLKPAERDLAQSLLARKAELSEPLQRLRAAPARRLGLKIRSHGDYHLGQVLVHRDGVSVLDFEGEPARPLAERRSKMSPLRDVAGMLRSLHYASIAARILPGTDPDAELPAAPALAAWQAQAHETFLRAYLAAHQANHHAEQQERHQGAESSVALLPDPEFFTALLDALLLEKAAYELRYEAQNRPDWAIIPLQGLASLLPGDR